MRNVMILVFLTIVMACGQDFNQHKSPPFEKIAVEFTADSLINNNKFIYYIDSLYPNVGLYDEFLLLKESSQIFSSGKLCSVTTPYQEFGSDGAQLSKRSQEYANDFQRKKNSIEPSNFVLAENIEKLEWGQYLNKKQKDSYFITARHDLKSLEDVVVEVNITSAKYLPNPSEFTFYIFMDYDGNVKNWKFVMKYEFDLILDC